MSEFLKGQVVRLKSGGPVMTVVGRAHLLSGPGFSNELKCTWFDGADLKEADFDEALLESTGPRRSRKITRS